MGIYYRWRQSEFHAVLGELGIGIDAVVNSQETKLLLIELYKANLQTKRFMHQKQDAEDSIANIKYFAWLEKHLGDSLRIFLEFGDRYPILQWFRRNISDIVFFTLIAYGLLWILSR